MAMYSGYFDESGHPDDSEHLIVAGALASVEQWVHFEREWKEALAPFGTCLFHTVDFEQRKPPFDHIDADQARVLSERLAGIICRRAEKLFSSTINIAHYRAMNAKYVFSDCYGYPYPIAARSCIGGVEAWASQHSLPMNEILVFFEDGAQHRHQLEWMAERDGIRKPDFPKKADAVPLQAGDFIAWHQAQLLNKTDKADYSASIVRMLERTSHSWKTTNLSDPDRIPAALGIPVRFPGFHYKYKIVQKHGVRRALIHYWKEDQKVDRKTLVLPDRRVMAPEEIDRALREYDEGKSSSKDG
jgi:hypothetical protein